MVLCLPGLLTPFGRAQLSFFSSFSVPFPPQIWVGFQPKIRRNLRGRRMRRICWRLGLVLVLRGWHFIPVPHKFLQTWTYLRSHCFLFVRSITNVSYYLGRSLNARVLVCPFFSLRYKDGFFSFKLESVNFVFKRRRGSCSFSDNSFPKWYML